MGVLGFNVDSRERVDQIYNDLTGAGYHGQQEPFDAFWGARYAVVEDPDGNAVRIMSPVDPDMQDGSWVPLDAYLLGDRTSCRSSRTYIIGWSFFGPGPGPRRSLSQLGPTVSAPRSRTRSRSRRSAETKTTPLVAAAVSATRVSSPWWAAWTTRTP